MKWSPPQAVVFIARYAILLLAVFGLLLVGLGVGIDVPDAVRTALVVMGSGAVTVALLRYHLEGPIKLGPQGFEGNLRRDELVQFFEREFPGAVEEEAARLNPGEQIVLVGTAEESDEALPVKVVVEKTGGGKARVSAGGSVSVEGRKTTLSDADAFRRRVFEKLADGVLSLDTCANCGAEIDPSHRGACPRCGATQRSYIRGGIENA